ncbi:cysteine synthase family protein [Buttiauxella sp. 3AFRM03]|uniref:PLP-dependent cysteine synthase family protein n=1 Tax=Buttiauxella sp. 3AFRM03 TaxID=2479367 RepID=UPI000EF76647|nr:cysteine synthase family protein [Buttiauxella sp. 3AFRM03]AYN28303.1 cysteine synthase family protein [Buttiauxella sp. 3AFRM03]
MHTSERNQTCNLLNLIGNTPVVNIMTSLFPYTDIKIKLESYNPGGSIKDRVALKMITDAEESGLIEPGYELVEATSGNTGIGIAWVGRLKGYKVTIFTHDKVSKEKLALLKFYGATVFVAQADLPADSESNYLNLAKDYCSSGYRYFCDQFNNLSNTLSHYKATAPELWLQGGRDADAIICGVGSGGTLMGLSKYFREKGSKAKFIVADPIGSIYKSYFCQQKHVSSSWKIEGIGSNFIPGIINQGVVDGVFSISDDEAFNACTMIRETEALDLGLSSGAIISAAMKLAETGTAKKIMCISPDAGERYMSKLQSHGDSDVRI